MPELLEANRIRLYTRETAAGEDIYELDVRQRSKRQQLATWERPAVTGPTAANPEEIISGWAQDDWSGGFGIEDADEGVDTARFRFGLIDARSPHQICLPPKVWRYEKPAGVSGSAIPVGDVGTQFYMGWGDEAVGFDESADGWHSTVNDIQGIPLECGTKFGGYTWIPFGNENVDYGLAGLEEVTPNSGTLAVTTVSTDIINPVALGRWDNKLYGIDGSETGFVLGFLTARGARTNPDGLADDSGDGWNYALNKFNDAVELEAGQEPTRLLTYHNRAGEPTLWCITRDGAYMWNPDEPRWMNASLEWGAHPDFGLDAHVWRGGEDLYIAAGGLDWLRYTAANVSVPLSGPSKDQGIPAAYSGKIVSMAAERSTLYFLVQGRQLESSPTWTEDDPDAAYFTTPSVPLWVGGWTGTAFMALAEVRDTTATPTRLYLSTASGGDYSLWWGDSDGNAYRIKIPYDFYNPRAKLELGVDPFHDEGWWESIRYDANMVGWDKLASHAFALMDFSSEDCYLDIEYRTDADLFQLSGELTTTEPSYHPWKRVTARGRTLLWFDDEETDATSGLPWREGLNFQWVQFRFRMYRGDNENLSPIMAAFSMHHVRIPQDAASLTLQIKVPAAEYVDISRPTDTANRLRALQRYGGYVHIQIDNETFLRGKMAGVSEERWMGDNQYDGTLSVIFVEVGAVENAHQSVA